MPNAMITGIAQGQSNQTNPAFNNTSQPWMKPQYDVNANNNVLSKSYLSGAHPEVAGKSYNFGGVGSDQYMNGDKGWGFYSMGTPDSQALQAQQYYNNQFQQNMPNLANQMTNQMARQVQGQVTQGIRNTRTNNSARGLLYGGVNAGQEQGVQNQGAQEVAQGRSSINQGLLNASNNMNQQAINQGFQYQQQQQAMQDSIYQDAMQRLAMDTAVTNAALSTTGSAVVKGAGGIFGGAAGAMA